MSQRAIKITLVCEPKIREEIETALTNSHIEFTTEEIQEPERASCIYISDLYWVLSVALHILKAKKDVVEGNIELLDGRKFDLSQEGIDQLEEILVNAMGRRREVDIPAQLWWTPFIPDIKEHFIPELRETIKKFNELIEWYPRASGEGKRIVTRNFLLLMGGILVVMFVLTWFDKISGDAFY